MNPNLMIATAHAHQNELRRYAKEARLAAEVAGPSRFPRLSLRAPRLRFGHTAPVGPTAAKA